MGSPRALRVLAVVTVRYAKNGITGVVKNYAECMSPAEALFDYVLINEPSASERAEIESRGGRIFVLPMRNKNPLAYGKRLRAIAASGAYDLLHVHGNSATMLFDLLPGKRAGIPVRIPHGHNTTCNSLLLHKLLSPPFRRSYTHALSCGAEAGAFLYGKYPFTVLNNAVDTGRYRFDAAERTRLRAALALAEDTILLGHVGSFIARKNQRFLIEAFAKAHAVKPCLRLALIGEGEHLPAARALAEVLSLKDAVIFPGGAENAAAWYSAFDCFALPSLQEGLPLTLVEAQCAGLPCLVSEGVTRASDLSGSCTFLPLDQSVWAAAMEGFAPAPERAIKSAASIAAVAASGYDIGKNAETLLGFYRAALSEVRACR